jgi:YggT family protein
VEAILCNLLGLYLVALFARIILSWFPARGDGPLATVNSALYTITEPVLGPLRRMLPPVGGSSFRIDLSPIIVFIGLNIIRSAMGCSSFLIF